MGCKTQCNALPDSNNNSLSRQTDTCLTASFPGKKNLDKLAPDFNETKDDRVAVALAGPYARHLHPCQNLITQFLQPG